MYLQPEKVQRSQNQDQNRAYKDSSGEPNSHQISLSFMRSPIKNLPRETQQRNVLYGETTQAGQKKEQHMQELRSTTVSPNIHREQAP